MAPPQRGVCWSFVRRSHAVEHPDLEGQVTIPEEVRERLGLKEGDRLIFRFDDQGNLLIRPEARSPLGRLPGLLHHLAGEQPVTVEEMNEAVKRRAAERFQEAVRR